MAEPHGSGEMNRTGMDKPGHKAGAWGGVGYTAAMQEDWVWPVVVLVVVLSPLVFVLLRVFYTQVQVHLLEYMLTLIISTLPMGLLLATAKGSTNPGRSAGAVVLGLFPMLAIIAGSLWGLSAARRMGEERTWPRLGLMLLGWTVLPSLACLLAGGVSLLLSVYELFIYGSPFPPLYPPVLFAGGAPLFLAMVVECRCKVHRLRKPGEKV